jgi:uncharacterized protein (DUF1501 family)
MKRRSFIKNSSVGLGAVSQIKLGQLDLSSFDSLYKIEEENENILIIIQLFGGNDGINTIIPKEWPDYYNRFRPKLHIPQDKSIAYDDPAKGMAMHPSLKDGIQDGMYGLFKEGKLSVIQGVGYHNPNLSHFRSTDIWFSGIIPANDGQSLPTGWLGRYFDQYQDRQLPDSPYCIHVGDTPLLLFQGDETENAILVESPDEFFEQGKSVESDKIVLGEQNLFSKEFDYVNNVGLKVNHFSKSVKIAFDKGSNRQDYAEDSLSEQMKLVARLIDGGLKTKVYSVSLGGFDTHGHQGVLDGLHSKLLSQLSSAISAFQSDIESMGHAKKVIGVTVSEFGRRPYENASLGTDHGTANVMFAFGEEVKGKVFGTSIAQLPFFDSENLVYRYDFRSIYQEILRSWFGASPSMTENIIAGTFPYIDGEGFIKQTVKDNTLPSQLIIPDINNDPKSPNNPSSPYNVEKQDIFQVFPNPTPDGKFILRMILFIGADVEIIQFNIKGIPMGTLLKRKTYRVGGYILNLELNGGHGLHFLHITANNRNHFIKIMRT